LATKIEHEAGATGRPVPDDRLRAFLYDLKLARYFDERMEALYRQGRLPGAIYSGRGQEGTHVGVAAALEDDDSLFPTHRDLTAQLTKGLDLKRVMAQYWGRIDGYTRGRDGNSHIGDWFAYGIPGIRVDGSDVLEVYAAARDAVDRARDGGGPTLIEAVSLRWRGHAGHDPARYVPRELLEHYMLSKDPVKNFEEYLREQGVVTDEDIADVQARVEREFDEGYQYALASPFPEPGDVTKGWWVEDGYWTSEPGRAGGTEAS
jgi:TPP-dependent pyruvate/acetoin dehydrogenase alpha subunit